MRAQGTKSKKKKGKLNRLFEAGLALTDDTRNKWRDYSVKGLRAAKVHVCSCRRNCPQGEIVLGEIYAQKTEYAFPDNTIKKFHADCAVTKGLVDRIAPAPPVKIPKPKKLSKRAAFDAGNRRRDAIMAQLARRRE